jgi:hypothetical protein
MHSNGSFETQRSTVSDRPPCPTDHRVRPTDHFHLQRISPASPRSRARAPVVCAHARPCRDLGRGDRARIAVCVRTFGRPFARPPTRSTDRDRASRPRGPIERVSGRGAATLGEAREVVTPRPGPIMRSALARATPVVTTNVKHTTQRRRSVAVRASKVRDDRAQRARARASWMDGWMDG